MINRTYSDIYSNVGSNIQDTSTSMQTIIKRYINDIYADFLRRINWDAINPDYQVPVVSGTQDYILPSNFGKEKYVYDATNKRAIPFISLDELAEKFPESLSSQGTVERYSIFKNNVRKQPTSASTLSFVSSSSADTTQTMRIKGTDSNDVELDESINLNGTTSVPTVNTYKEIRSISASASRTGRVTVTSNSGAVTVAILAPADLDYKVIILRLHQVPGSALTLNIPYHIKPYPLTNDYDVPVVDCADVIENGATAKAWRYKRQFAKAADYERLYEQGIISLTWDKENQPNQTHQLNPKTYSREYV